MNSFERKMRFALDDPYYGPYEQRIDAESWASRAQLIFRDTIFRVISVAGGFGVEQDLPNGR